MRLPALTLLFAVLLWGCARCPEGDTAGNSVGCGNPVKIAELHPLAQNECRSSSGACAGSPVPPTRYALDFGGALRISMRFPRLIALDSVRGTLFLYEGDQVPVFSPAAMDSLPLRDSSFLITPEALGKFSRRGLEDSSYSAFSAHIRLLFHIRGLAYPQEGLLTGLAYDWKFGAFSHSVNSRFSQAGRGLFLDDPAGFYQGAIRAPDTLLAGAASAFVYIPGSGFAAEVDLEGKNFRLGSLPLGEEHELRFFARSITELTNSSIPVFLLESDSGAGQDRAFRLKATEDSIDLP